MRPYPIRDIEDWLLDGYAQTDEERYAFMTLSRYDGTWVFGFLPM